MNQSLLQLIQICNLDKEIDSLEPQIELKKSDLNKAIRTKEFKQHEYFDLEEQTKELILQVSKNNQAIQEESTKLEAVYKKISEVRSERELKSLNIEEEIAKERITQANSEIQRLENELSHTNELQNSLNTQIFELDNTIVGIEGKVNDEVKIIKAQQQKIFEQKQVLIVKMDQKLISFYEKVRKWARNSSVVPVHKQACGGCFIRINDRIYAEIIQSSDIITCPHCGRILYLEESR